MTGPVAKHRARMKERGYKEVRYWVPDVNSAEFTGRIRSEALAVNTADGRDGSADFLEEIQADVFGGR